MKTNLSEPIHPIDTALRIAAAAHAGHLDEAGGPAILHPLAVGLLGHTDEEKAAGFLHEAVKDSGISFKDLLREGIPEGVVNALRLLARPEGTDEDTYVQRVLDAGHPIALQVLYNDLRVHVEQEQARPDAPTKLRKVLERVKAAVEAASAVQRYEGPKGTGLETGIFACGCFWGTQHQFARQPGVVRTWVGYTGGEEAFPTYADVRSHQTHHVEAVLVEFDPQAVTYETLCQLFFEIHDPAQTDGVGPDLGPQYRSCLFFRNEAQRQTAEQVIRQLRDKGYVVNTLLRPATDFYIGEAWHQHYYEQTGGTPYCHLRVRKF
ncbi:MAG: peptide-methionine (S)-S-oxide reductase MsrA [Bacteroidales bacterium]|nr:peptide-methionine (S)-S-oxide reductase MsrA [Bacteroidales bacterium]